MLIGRTAFVVSLLLIATVSAQEKPSKAHERLSLPPAAVAAMNGISKENIETHVRFLSHDLLEGRGTGARGGDIAAQYIAAQFALYGLKPAGDNGTYLQKVPLVGVTPGADTRFTFAPSTGAPTGFKVMDLKMLDDYVVYDQTQQSVSDINAPIVYVGYGIVAPEYNWDDYKGIDVKGNRSC